jgi:hypothetical protein
MIFAEPLGSQFWIALPLFVIGALIVILEQWKGPHQTDEPGASGDKGRNAG